MQMSIILKDYVHNEVVCISKQDVLISGALKCFFERSLHCVLIYNDSIAL